MIAALAAASCPPRPANLFPWSIDVRITPFVEFGVMIIGGVAVFWYFDRRKYAHDSVPSRPRGCHDRGWVGDGDFSPFQATRRARLYHRRGDHRPAYAAVSTHSR